MHDHLAHFYEPGASNLVTSVARHIAGALGGGHVALVVAQAERLNGIHDALEALDVDTRDAVKRGRLDYLDGLDVLHALMFAGRPDPEAFDRVIGQKVREMLGRRHAPSLYAYGELVGMLWNAGNEVGAIEVERLWNQLLEDLPASLHCGYPMSGFDQAVWSDTMEAVLSLHTGAIPERITAHSA